MKTLRSQLSLYILTIVLVMVALVSLFANVAVNRQFEEYIISQEQEQRKKIVDDLEKLYHEMNRSWDLEYLHTIGMYSLYDGYVLSVYDGSGEMIWDAQSHDMALCKQIMSDITTRMSQRKNTEGFHTYSYDLKQEEQKIGSVSIKSYGPYFLKENEFRFINAMNALLLLIGIASCAVSIITGGLLAYRIARPITKTAEIAEQIAAGNYNIRFESETKTQELSKLISSINDMAGALSRQEQYRKQLTSDIAHELRTPLTAIHSHLEAMAEGLWEPTPERLNGCLDEVKRLGSLIADLNRLAKLEQENVTLNITDVELLETVHAVFLNFEKEADNKKIKIQIDGTASVVPADKARIIQVITNLLSNAIKYTPDGGKIHIEVKDELSDGVVIIEDNGIGISEKDLPDIFKRFYRTERSRNRKTGGAGIGLTIAKSIVEAHDGRIAVESAEGSGTRFMVTFPKK